MIATGREIHVWFDDLTPELDHAKWIVSLCEQDGHELGMIEMYDDYREAVARGRMESESRGLPVIEIGHSGERSAL
jgi:hypothetical protein